MPLLRSVHAAALTVALLGPGCFKSYVAVSFKPPPLPDASADVHEAAPLAALRPELKTVAVRAPATCLARQVGPAAGPGVAARSQTLLEARCAVVLGELERALGDRFKVVPWKELAAAEKAAGLAHLAAQQLTADAVVEVTGFDVLPLLVTDLWGSVVLTNANADGSSRGPADLTRRSQRRIRELVEERFRDGALAGVVLDLELTVLSAATGAPVWTYRRAAGADLDGARDLRLLVRGRTSTWRPVERRGGSDPVAPPGEDPIRARLRDLAHQVAQDAAARLATQG